MPLSSTSRPLRIRSQLILTALAIVLPVALAAGLAIQHIVSQAREAALQRLLERAHATAARVDREIWSSISALRTLATSPQLAQGDLRAFHARLAAVNELPDRWTALLDASGQHLVNAAVSFGTPLGPPQPGEPERVAQVLASGQPLVTDIITGRITGRSITVVYVPLPPTAGMEGVIGQAVTLGFWQRTALGGDLPEGWVVGLLDRQGRFISRSRDAEPRLGQPGAPGIVQAAGAAASGVLRTLSAEGTPIYAAFAHSASTGWTITVGAAASQVEAPARRALWIGLVGLLATLLLATVVMAVFGRRLSRELREAGHAARELGLGLRPRLSPSRVREIGELKDAIDEAADVLQHEQESRTAAEGAVLQVEQRLAGILRTASDAVIVTDEDQSVVLYNQAAEAMFGRVREQVLGLDIRRLLPPDCWERYLQQTRSPRDAPEDERLAHRAIVSGRRADGTSFPMECSVSRHVDPDGSSFHTVIARDITQRMRDREALLQAHESLRKVTQAYQRTLMSEVETRLERIARDLHDSVGSSLAGILLLLGAVRDRTPDAAQAQLLEKAREQLAASAEAVRTISRGIMPVGSEAGALLQALEQYAQNLSSFKAIDCNVRARGEFDEIAPVVGTHVYRIVQEAVTNAIRHGGATRLRIVLVQGPRHYRLTVLDNGSGCEPAPMQDAHPGMGLRSMQARALAIGGRLEMGPYGQRGCRVRVCWPRASARAASGSADQLNLVA